MLNKLLEKYLLQPGPVSLPAVKVLSGFLLARVSERPHGTLPCFSGVGIGVVHAGYERRLAHHLGAHSTPSILGIINGKISFFHNAVVHENLRQFVESLLPGNLVEKVSVRWERAANQNLPVFTLSSLAYTVSFHPIFLIKPGRPKAEAGVQSRRKVTLLITSSQVLSHPRNLICFTVVFPKQRS